MYEPEDLEKNRKAYKENPKFKEFLDAFAKSRDISVEEALYLKQVTITREYYEEKG